MIKEMIFPASDWLVQQLIKWSEVVAIRSTKPSIRPQFPFNSEFAPGISLYSATFMLFKAILYEKLQTYADNNSIEIPEIKYIYAPDSELATLGNDWTFVLNLPGSAGHPYGYLQGSVDADFYDKELDVNFTQYLDKLKIGYSLERYSGLIKSNSSSGMPLFTTDLATKVAYLLRLNRMWYNQSEKAVDTNNYKTIFDNMMTLEWAPLFWVNSRLQPAKGSKKFDERTVYNRMVFSDRTCGYAEPALENLFNPLTQQLGINFVHKYFLANRGDWEKEVDKGTWMAFFLSMRTRRPFMGPSSNATYAVIAPAIQNTLIDNYPHIYEIGDRLTLENRINNLAIQWKRVFFLAVDFRHFEMKWPHFIQYKICQLLDKLMPKGYQNYTEWYMLSCVLMNARTKKDFDYSPIFTSKNYDTHEGIHLEGEYVTSRIPLKTEGNLSGQAFVALFNKIFGSFMIIDLLNKSLKTNKDYDLNNYSESSDIQFINNGDDNLIFFKNENEAKTVLSFILKIKEVNKIELTIDLPSFNAINILEKKRDDRYYYYARPSIQNFIAKWIVPEYDYGIIKKGVADYPNLGRHYRTMNFLAADYNTEVVDILFQVFKDVYKRDLLDFFPLTDVEKDVMNNEMMSPDVEDIWKVFEYTDPSKFFWHPLARYAPQEVLKKFAAVVTADQLDTFLKGGRVWPN